MQKGAAAEDNADYKLAEDLLDGACKEAAASPEPEDQHRPCLRLARLYAVQARYKQSEAALEELVGRLASAPKARPRDLVEAFTELANVRAAQAKFEESREALVQCGAHLDRLSPPDLALAYVRFAQFYLPIDRQAPGGDFLRAAGEVLDRRPAFDDHEYVNAAVELARTMKDSGRVNDAEEVLEPFLEQARALFAAEPVPNVALRAAYRSAIGDYAALLKALGHLERSEELRKQVAEWNLRPVASAPLRAPEVENAVHRVSAAVQAPKLTKKKEPVMTEGARVNRVQGRVLLGVEVWPDGRAHYIRVIRPLPYGLHWEAMRAVRQWRFKPGTKAGQPVKVYATVEVNFVFR